MIISVHQPQYIPWLGYFDKIARSGAFVFLDCVQYKVREFQNRNKIRTSESWAWLTVPVVTKGEGRQKICDVRIDNETDWGKQHLRGLETCYGKAKFFDKHINFFAGIYSKHWDRLVDLNLEIISYLLKQLSVNTPAYLESQLKTFDTKTDRIIELCLKLKADTYLSGIGGRDYLEEDKFKQAGITLIYQEFQHPVYRQQFMKDKDDFLPYMSVVDLLFNEGENIKNILNIG